MSSSVLPFPPPMDSAPISFASAGTPSRTVPRRTYGRRRAASPPPEEEAFRSLFQPLPEPHISPAKGLLNRWSGASTSWRDSLALLDADRTGEIDAETAKRELDRLRKEARTVLPRPRASSPANEEDVGLEEAKKEMERMRREARGEVVSNMPTTTAKSGLEVPSGKLVTAFSSSSLTALPTSTPPSSPPKARANTSHCPAQSMEDETIPVRNPGMAKYSGRIKRVIASPDEEQSDDEPIRKRRSPPRGPSSPASVSDEETPRRAPYSTMRPIRVASPTRDSTPTAEDDEAPLDNLQQFLSTLADDAKQPNDAREPSTESINDPAGLFDDEGMEKGGKSKNGKGGRALKSLNQKELADMRKDIARAQRERPVPISKPEVQRLPITSWLATAGRAITLEKNDRAEVPGLTFGRGSSPRSPFHTTPHDEIVAFTPSSADQVRPNLNGLGELSNITIEAESSSPLLRRQHRKTFVPSTSEDRDDERLPDIAELLEQEEKRRQQVEARKRMAEVKAAAIRASANAEANLDDDLDIYHDTPRSKPEVRHLKDARGRDVPDARAVLAKTSAIPAVSKQRQAMLRRAGKIARPKEDVTETFVDFAGKAFKHAELKGINAGAVPAGQKKGRDNLISQAQVDAMIRAKHQQQIAALQKKKEEDWGRVRPLPKKEQQDMQAILEMTARAAEDARDESEEDDGEDDEFIPERDDEDQEDGGMEYSGEENGAEEGSDEEVGEDLESVGTDKEALPAVAAEMDEDEIAPVIRRKPRVSNRAVFDSDEEGDTKPPPSTIRPPLAEVTISPQAISLVGQDLDLSGFGSGSVGFSQLFEATQPADQPTAINGFAQLRDKVPVRLLPAHALLPQVDISETQVARDNALIAGEVDLAMGGTAPSQHVPKAQYLNDQGFFTQTRPLAAVGTQMSGKQGSSSTRGALGGKSELSLMGYGFDETQLANASPYSIRNRKNPIPLTSPTQETHILSRLKRRASSTEVDTQSSSSRTVEDDGSRPKNAFDTMIKAAKRSRDTIIKSNLVDEQAEESDEDNGWAPIGGPEDDDEDNDEDGYVPDLLDDEQVDEEEEKRQDELAAEKAREMAAGDDARREAEARKITEGQYRTKRRGLDFYSDDEDDENKPCRLSKKQRRKRMLGREDGLDKLEGEANVFKRAYENDLESDVESVEGHPEPERRSSVSPVPAKQSARETWELLRQRGRMNRQKDHAVETQDLDREIGFDGAGFGGIPEVEEDFDMLEPEEESHFSISRSIRTSTSIVFDHDQIAIRKATVNRNVESYVQYVRDESQMTRRVGGAAGVSVVVNTSRGAIASHNGPSRQSSTGSGGRAPSRQGSGSILMSKTNKFM